jgi:hypothetical protein
MICSLSTLTTILIGNAVENGLNDNDSVQRNRQRLLHTRRQGPSDPTEQFVFEIVN